MADRVASEESETGRLEGLLSLLLRCPPLGVVESSHVEIGAIPLARCPFLSLCVPDFLTRCIKPNDQQQQGRFTSEMVTVQARYLGLLENVRVRRAGYAFRQGYKPFLERYRLLSRSTWPRWNGDDR